MKDDWFHDEFPELPDPEFDPPDELPDPEIVPVCAGCGCSQFDPCEGGCVWATFELCSRCV